jgi:hypothetical protein
MNVQQRVASSTRLSSSSGYVAFMLSRHCAWNRFTYSTTWCQPPMQIGTAWAEGRRGQ